MMRMMRTWLARQFIRLGNVSASIAEAVASINTAKAEPEEATT